MELLQEVHQKQYFRHVVANKLTLPLTVLREFKDGRTVGKRAINLATQNLESIMRFISAWKAKEV